MPRFIFFVLVCMVIAIPVYNKITTLKTVNASLIGNVAMRGYDPVELKTNHHLLAGAEEYETVYSGAKWRFVTELNQAHFQLTPNNYMPQFGGYCAYGVAEGYLADGNPKQWVIANNKLYFFFSEGQKALWNQNQNILQQQAHRQWPKITNK
ncbi:MAG: YHS domain-containing (seleno)protein [Desulfovibrio sp.]